ncbi:Na+/H+ antiporter subunit E [Pseudoxanthobacter sp.]|uniref:Na+/H+ antiporter subunit E n=1 Tax=Pseudoxanthobacter sp. TaxID=1925742 RepID=UPI002FE0A8A3
MTAGNGTAPGGSRAGGFITLSVLLFAAWMAIASELAVDIALLGLAVSAGLAAWFVQISPVWRQVCWSPAGLRALVVFLAVFAVALVRANIAMLRIVFGRRIAIAPGIVRVRTRLTSPLGRLALANAIALTPGSLVLGYEGDILYIHCLNADATDIETATARIAAPFERHLEAAFG